MDGSDGTMADGTLLKARPEPIQIDLGRTALIVVDMQNRVFVAHLCDTLLLRAVKITIVKLDRLL